jgi:RNA polymerase sigma-70 factor, ECF subfamily
METDVGMAERTRGPLFLVPAAPVSAEHERGDVELVVAFNRGESRAAEAIWERYAPLVRRLVQRAVGPDGATEDLVQEAFLRLYRKLPGLRQASALPGFVVTVTTRVVQTELRARWLRRWLGLSPSGVLPETPADDSDLEAREALIRFYRLLDELRPRHRTVFVLRYVEGLELTDVAAACGVSLATVKRWLPRIAGRIQRQAGGDPVLQRYVARGAVSAAREGRGHE